jgi:hypothetical protein
MSAPRLGTCQEPGPGALHCTEHAAHRYSCYDAGADESWNDRFPEDWQTDTPHNCDDQACLDAARATRPSADSGTSP